MSEPKTPTNKKHKKHKKEKQHETPTSAGGENKPPGLKLILKVGSQPPAESASIDSSAQPSKMGDEAQQAVDALSKDDRQHKKAKKKKKKKDRDKHDKKHKHHHKEKKKRPRDESSQDDISLGEDSLSDPPKRVKMEPDGPIREPRTCVLRQRQERTALQKLLDHLLKTLEKRDPQQFFAWPVTDHIAPGYSQIIQQPMDFSTMKQKIDENMYPTMNDYIEDFKLMCNNAMVYNHPETIYFKAAKKLLHVGLRIMTPDKLKPLIPLVPCMVELNRAQLGFDLGHEDRIIDVPDDLATTEDAISADSKSQETIRPLSKFEAIPDEMSPEEILAQAQKAAKGAADRLSVRKSCSMGFLRQKDDGSTSLAILVPGSGVTPGTNERPVSLGQLTGKLTHGTGQLQGFREDRRNMTKTVKPLYYGAFGSYAPSYDSTFANLTKEESDLVYHTYGDETAVQYAESILDFSKDCDYTLTMVDNLLDLLTSGEHKRTKKILDDHRKLREEEEKIRMLMENKSKPGGEGVDKVDAKVDVNSLKGLGDCGIDVGFLEELEVEAPAPISLTEEQEGIQSRLDQTSMLLQQLQQVQNDRLSLPPPVHLNQVPGPSDGEMQLADRITESLKDLAKKAGPGTVAPVVAIRKAIGVAPPPAPTPAQAEPDVLVPDLESELREFLESEPALSNSPLNDDKTIEEILSES